MRNRKAMDANVGAVGKADAANLKSWAVSPREEAAVSAFDSILNALSRVVSPALIDDAGWTRLRAEIGGLPLDPGTGFGFELRLAEPDARSDFYIALTRESTLRGYLVRLGIQAPPGSTAACLAKRLATLDTDAPWCEMLLLEWDIISGLPDAHPGLFAKIRFDSTDVVAATEWLTSAVGWQLTGYEARSLARTCDRVATAGEAVNCLGIMPDRPERTIKVICRPTDIAGAARILENLPWRGAVGRVASFLTEFAGSFRSLRLAIGVTAAGVLPQIGVELSRSPPESFGLPAGGDWTPFLARLGNTGLCLPEKMAGLKAWPGREFVFSGKETYCVVTGMGGHIKLSFNAAGDAVEAKAYPAVAYQPFAAMRAWLESQTSRKVES